MMGAGFETAKRAARRHPYWLGLAIVSRCAAAGLVPFVIAASGGQAWWFFSAFSLAIRDGPPSPLPIIGGVAVLLAASYVAALPAYLAVLAPADGPDHRSEPPGAPAIGRTTALMSAAALAVSLRAAGWVGAIGLITLPVRLPGDQFTDEEAWFYAAACLLAPLALRFACLLIVPLSGVTGRLAPLRAV